MKAMLAAALALALVPAPSLAEDKPLTLVSTADMLARIKKPKPWSFTIVDARSQTEYEEGHIEGSVNLPAEQTTAKLPKMESDKARDIIFYCNGVKCTKSTKAARAALALGYTNVLEYNEGMPAWSKTDQKIVGTPLPAFQADAISPAELGKALASPEAPFMLDVRPIDEFAKFHIKGSMNIPLDDVKANAAKLNKAKSVVIVDHAGHQTLVAGRLLKSLGHDPKRLGGGLLAWKEANMPVEEGVAKK
jgi:rhodanese-related sulfurtransferase